MGWIVWYDEDMDKQALQRTVDLKAAQVWRRLVCMHSELVRFDVPTIKLNGRLYRTAGRCYQDENVVELGTQFFTYKDGWHREMLEVILPHEIIHRADWVLYGKSEKKCGHGKTWQRLMVQYGLEPSPYHNLWITK